MHDATCCGEGGASPAAVDFSSIQERAESTLTLSSCQDLAASWVGRRYGLRESMARVVAAAAGLGAAA